MCAGEFLSGQIHVHLEQDLFATKLLTLTLRVEETTKMRKLHYTKKDGHHEEDHYGSHRFFSIDFPIYNCSQEDSPRRGHHSFPFSIKLPEWLPASMCCATGYNLSYAGIEYTLVAQFVPIQKKYWADEENNISSFNCEAPLYIMKKI